MPIFKDLEGQTLQFGNEETYLVEDEKAFILKLDEQLRAVDLNNPEHISFMKHNLNQLSNELGLDPLPKSSDIDEATAQTIKYFNDNRKLFIEYGIKNHPRAKQLEKMTAPAFTPTEYAPTIDEMIKLEVDIGKLYED